MVNNYLTPESLKLLNLEHIRVEDVTLIPELLGVKNIENIKKYLNDDEIKEANIRFLSQEELFYTLGKGEKLNE